MLWLVSAFLLVVWLAGMLAGTGAWIHVVLVAAALAVAACLVRPDRFDTI
jgi:hypothetical protein